ncbi:YHS domain-containing (seleno)protein [Agaribacter flavus]|uniref:YHS domain-containing (Seleno)protein n=1 Tax=Agaribacter flavus TaxID=1902781 RepID=A0ABV7FRH1_9ALTE
MNFARLLLLLVITSFSLNTLAKEDAIETGTFNNFAIYGYDTVAYFTENKAVKGNKKITTEWRGAEWHFSSEENKALFVASPEKYAPQYGGHCAYAMSRGKFVGIDEDAFTIRDGKLYLNYSKSVREDWLEDPEGYIQKADIEYAKEVEL